MDAGAPGLLRGLRDSAQPSLGPDSLVALAMTRSYASRHHLRHFEFRFDQGRHMGYSVTRMP